MAMKFFTREWWEKQGEDWEPFRRYEAYIASVRPQLPTALLDLWEGHTLHDAEVKRLESRFQDRTVAMALDGWDRELQNPVRYSLVFGGVSEFDQILPPGPYLEEELGDLGYWECEFLNPFVELRMLFVSGAEFRVVFEEFSFEHRAREV
ncbi:MAG TPA: hypothetical protein VF522_18255 [Ramlibacter sp.]|uniref:hypothetical protein n=1 Tax=Ramlibacter sp. TaxID=1917967 RepID=UPI002ED17C0B